MFCGIADDRTVPVSGLLPPRVDPVVSRFIIGVYMPKQMWLVQMNRVYLLIEMIGVSPKIVSFALKKTLKIRLDRGESFDGRRQVVAISSLYERALCIKLLSIEDKA